MKPILFSVGPFHVYSFGVCIAAGLFISLFLMNRQASRGGFPLASQVQNMIFVILVSGLLGARFHYVLQNADWYLAHPGKVLAFWEGGLIFYGGVVTAFFAFLVYAQVKKVPFLEGLDFLVPYVALIHTFGRIGCFMTGCCYGRYCNLPWAVSFPDLAHAVHPTQLYEAFFLFWLFLFLRRQYARKGFKGEVVALYFLGYALGRFAIEYFRADNPSFYGLTWNQWISLVVFISATFFYRWLEKRNVKA